MSNKIQQFHFTWWHIPTVIEDHLTFTTDAYRYAQEEEIRYQQTEVFFMVFKDVDSVMTCGAALAQMPKGEKHFANTGPCKTHNTTRNLQ